MLNLAAEWIMHEVDGHDGHLPRINAPIGVRGEIGLGEGTGMLSRQDWVEVRARERRRRDEAHGLEKLITGNAFSKHFRRFLVTAQTK